MEQGGLTLAGTKEVKCVLSEMQMDYEMEKKQYVYQPSLQHHHTDSQDDRDRKYNP